MRILIVSNLFPPNTVGGYETECATVVERFAEAHEVRVLTSTGKGANRHGSAAVVRTLALSGHSKLDVLAAPFRSVRAARAMRRQLAEFQPEVVWIWNGAGIPQAAIRIAEGAGPIVVWRICEQWFADLYRADLFLRHLYGDDHGLWLLWAGFARLVNRHPSLRIELRSVVPAAISWNSDALRTATPIPATVDPLLERMIHPATAQTTMLASVERQPAPTPLLAFLGRLEVHKGAHVAVEALAELSRRHHITADLVLAGPARRSDRRRLLQLADRLGVRDRVQMPGTLRGAEVANLLSRAHVVVVPAVWHEPFGLVPVEAAIAGVPVVAARSGGLVEALREPDEALFFPIGDASACADAVAETLRDHARTAERVRRARIRAREFGVDRYLAETTTFFADAVRALGATP